jgi:hypothetical protein
MALTPTYSFRSLIKVGQNVARMESTRVRSLADAQDDTARPIRLFLSDELKEQYVGINVRKGYPTFHIVNYPVSTLTIRLRQNAEHRMEGFLDCVSLFDTGLITSARLVDSATSQLRDQDPSQ